LARALENNLMAISDPNRAYFEDVSLSLVRRELPRRIPYYSNNNEQRRLASEWVEEELAKLVQEKPVANMQGTKRFYAALLVSTLAASRTATGRR
jgi:hypothetical protein